MPIFINNDRVNSFLFPGGECQVRIDQCIVGNFLFVEAVLHSAYDIMELLLTIDSIRNINNYCKIHLYIPYMPYARQDRICNPGEAFSLKVFCDLVNSLNCERVTILDPHSDVSNNLLNRCRSISLYELISDSRLMKFIYQDDMVIVSPDKGSASKVGELSHRMFKDCVYAEKIRCSNTGNIIRTEITGDFKGKNVFILDDICDGGSTFIELSKILKLNGAKELYLYVTNGIFSKGLEILKPYFDHIYCFHTMLKQKEIDCSFLTLIENDYHKKRINLNAN